MKIAHIADLHCCRENAEEALTSLRFFADHIKKSPVSLVALAGDTWDASMLNTEGSGFNRFIDAIREIADNAPVAMIYGTPAHDTDGSLEVFRKVTSKYGITILEPGQPYFLTEINGKGKIVQEMPGVSGKAVLFGIPEPRKKYLLAGASAGKDETEEAIRSAMHKMCYLLAAKRKEYADIPCFVLYHGEVAGTSYQNDQTVERGTGIAITIDDLADIGADYYALGHIHKPQKVGNLNAYYAGSIYPKNFGETHQASFKIVDVEPSIENERLTSVNTIDFPHPQNMKVELRGDDILDKSYAGFPDKNVKGKRVWLEIACTKEQRALFSAEELLAEMFAGGVAPGSRVTLCDIPVETVRAAEITEVNTPAKKYEVWAKNSNIEATESHLKKIEALNAEIAKHDIKPEGTWELLSLRLKGSVGIAHGIKQEEIFLNFETYADGLIALSGDNGKGKTTCIENCHPYPQLFTRKGKLQDHFNLKDSFREVIYRNHADGSLWKFLIQIDGQNKSGSCKYFIFKKPADAADWEPLPDVDGNLKPYEDALSTIFGPVELYLRTAFITQRTTKNLPDITDATAGEKKTLFVALAGIDYLQGFSDAAADKAKGETAKAHDAEIQTKVLQDAIGKKPQEERILKDTGALLEAKNVELADITKKGKGAKVEVDRLQAAWSAEQVRQQKENEAKASVDSINGEIDNLAMDVIEQTEASDNKAQYEKAIAEYEAQQKIIDAETAKKQAHTETELKAQQEHARQKAAYDESRKGLDAGIEIRRNQITGAENNIKLAERDEEVERNRLCKPLYDRKGEINSLILTAQKDIELYGRDATEITEDCPTCGHKLPENKLTELKAKREEYIQKIRAQKTEIEKLYTLDKDIDKRIAEAKQQAVDQRDAKIKTARAEIEGCNVRIKEIAQQISKLAAPEEPKHSAFDDTALRTAQQAQGKIDIQRTRASLAQAQEAAVRIEGLQLQIAEKQKLLAIKEAEYKKVRQEPSVGVGIKSALDTATTLHSYLTEQYTAVKSEIAGLEATIEAVKKNLAEIVEKEKQCATLERESRIATIEAQEWELIAKAFGKDGIQALELDALAPGISETANRILESAYGDRFRIDIETTRIGGNGSKKKQIEDFLIYVTDSEDGERRLLENLSGGEGVWVKKAIYDAFSIVRQKNTGFSFKTAFQDEADGALDAASKIAYCRMLEAFHEESKMRHTIIITHSDSVKASIPQQINMETQWQT